MPDSTPAAASLSSGATLQGAAGLCRCGVDGDTRRCDRRHPDGRKTRRFHVRLVDASEGQAGSIPATCFGRKPAMYCG